MAAVRLRRIFHLNSSRGAYIWRGDLTEENERWLAIWQNSVVHRLISRQTRHSAVKRDGIYATIKLKWSANTIAFIALVM